MRFPLRFLSRPIDPSGKFQEQFRRRFTLTLMMIGALFLLSFAPVDYYAGLPGLAMVNVVFSFLLLLAAAYMHWKGQVQQVTRFGVAGFLLWFAMTIPMSVLVTIWFPVFPLVAFFGLGRREGMWWSVGFLFLVALEYLICRQMGIYIANDIFLTSTLACLALIILSVVYYQRLLELLQEAVSKQFTQLQHAQRMESIGVLAGGVAHDFNNLLVGIMGNIELLMLNADRDQPRYRQLEDVLKSAQRGEALVRQLLAFAGKGGWEYGVIDLRAFFADIRPAIESVVGEQVQLELDVGGTLLPIEGDPKQLEQVVLNLLVNALEAAIPGRQCRIRIGIGMQPDGDLPSMTLNALQDERAGTPLVYLQIEDNGRGIEGEMIDKVFDPFFTTKEAGSGLGLAAVAGVMRSMHGAVQVQSRKGEGCRFTLWFPAVDEEAPGKHEETARAQFQQGASLPKLQGTVLLVDDERMVRVVARKMLEAAGLQVLEAEDGATALRLMQEKGEHIALLVLDFTLPDMNGDRVYDVLVRRGAVPPTIICSGYGEVEGVRHVQRQGGCFVRKPFRMQELIEVARRCLEETR